MSAQRPGHGPSDSAPSGPFSSGGASSSVASDDAARPSSGAAPAPGAAPRTGGLLAGADWARTPPAHTVTLLGKPGCHLCEDAREVVVAVCEQTGSAYSERDVTGDPQLLRDYAEFVPVVFVDGVPWDRLRIDAERLRAVLA